MKGTSPDRVPGQKIWSSYDVTYFEEGYPLWYLRTFMVDHVDQATGAAVVAAEQLKATKVAIIYVDLDFGTTQVNAFKAKLEKDYPNVQVVY